MNSSNRYWNDWNPEERPSAFRKSEYSAGVMVESTSHVAVSCVCTREMRASILNDGSSESFLTQAMTPFSSCRNRRSHSSDVWCTMMNIISSCSNVSGFCASSNLSRCRYSAYESEEPSSQWMGSSDRSTRSDLS